MEVKTGALRNNLSRYLRRVRDTGDSIIVLDRDTPIAEIRPFKAQDPKAPSKIWDLRRRTDLEQGVQLEAIELPERYTAARKFENPLD